MQDHRSVEGEFSYFVLVHQLGTMKRLAYGFEVMVDFFVDGRLCEDDDAVIRHYEEGQYLAIGFVFDCDFLFEGTFLPG